MKNTKISKFMGVGLTVALLTSLLAVAGPASAATDPDALKWGPVGNMPSAEISVNQLLAGSDVSDIAVATGGTTVYALDGQGGRVLKSTNSGNTWKILADDDLATIAVPQFVAVAPGDPNTVLVVGDTNEAVISSDGGTTFNPLTNHMMTAIKGVAISPVAAGKRYVAFAGTGGTIPGPEVAYLNIGTDSLGGGWTFTLDNAAGAPDWTANSTPTTNITSVKAVAFSPNFASDKVMVAVADANYGITNNATLHIASFSSKKWDTNAGFNDYPVQILTSTTAGAVSNGSLTAVISMAPTYLGADETSRVVFVGLATTGSSKGGAFRLTNNTVSNRTGTTSPAPYAISSIDFNGADMVAGNANDNNVYLQTGALTGSTTPAATTIYQRPGAVGNTKTQVAWAGANVVAGTTGTDSAFALSKDKGATFNDVSLIDTNLNTLKDVAVTKDANVLFLVSNDGVNSSFWRRSGSTWERLLNLAGINDYIVRIAPESTANVSYVYLADTDTTNLWYSGDSGEKSWALRAVATAGFPIDLAVESAQVSYVLDNNGQVSKSSNSGFTWETPIASGILDAATITSVKANQLIVGNFDGEIAWSTDGNAAAATWVQKTGADAPFQTEGGAVQTAADKLDAGGFIYAATYNSGEVRRFKVGTSTKWDDIVGGTLNDILVDQDGNVIGSDAEVYGLVLSDGVLFAAGDIYNNDTDEWVGFMARNLAPSLATDTIPPGLWTGVATEDAADFDNEPSALRATTGKLWAIDTNESILNVFADTVYNTKAVQQLPADLAVPQTNPVSGNSQDVSFSWARLSLSTSYTIQISLDSTFNQLLVNTEFTPTPTTANPAVAIIGPNNVNGFLAYAPNVTYYWRVRAIEPLESPWSTTRSFTFTSLEPPFVINGPEVGASGVSTNPILSWTTYRGTGNITALWYEVTLSEFPDFSIPEWSHNVYGLVYGVTKDETLKNSTTYFWRVRGVTATPYVQGTRIITPAGPWQVGAFTTMAAPVAVPTQQIIITQPAPPAETKTVETTKEVLVPQPIPNWMLITIIVIGAVLVIALIVLIVRTRRVA